MSTILHEQHEQHAEIARRHERARIGSLSRSRPADDPELVAARRNLAALKLERTVREIIADWPPISDQQVENVVAILRAG